MEALFRTHDGGYLFIQDSEESGCDFDYTLYDEDFVDIDGGVIGEGGLLDIFSMAEEIAGSGITLVNLKEVPYEFL